MVPYFEKDIIFASIYQRPYILGQTAVLVHLLTIFLNVRLYREIREASVSNGEGLDLDSPREPAPFPGLRLGPTE